MQILAVADTEERSLWDHWSEDTAERFSDVGLILSAGDLAAEYLEFLVTMLNVPLVYVRGNHDSAYEGSPPEGCIDADGLVVEVKCPEKGGSKGYKLGEEGLRTVRILGLGGSMRYKYGAGDMYTEREMTRRVVKTSLTLASDRLKGKGGIDILLTHAPCSGYGDMEDIPHQGFKCFNSLLEKTMPKFHVYGHVHKEYGGAVFDGGAAVGSTTGRSADGTQQVKGFHRIIGHPSGTTLINASGYHIIEI